MQNTAPKWLLWAGIMLVLWNLIGVASFASAVMMTPADLAAHPDDQRMLWEQMTSLGWVAFGVGTIGGLLAALGILFKKKWAVLFALLSFIGIIIQFFPTFFINKGINVWQPQFYALPLAIFVVALIQLWLARKANANGWTR